MPVSLQALGNNNMHTGTYIPHVSIYNNTLTQ